MNPYAVSPRALRNLRSIRSYIAKDNEAAADRLMLQLQAAFQHLADWPLTGRLRPEITPRSIRFWPFGNYVVAYDGAARPLRILSVMHGARNLPRLIR